MTRARAIAALCGLAANFLQSQNAPYLAGLMLC